MEETDYTGSPVMVIANFSSICRFVCKLVLT